MKIAILAPPYLSVPPDGYGGTEKIVSLLTEGLVAKGMDVTLFATGDSKTRAKLHSIFPTALGNSGLDKKNLLLPLLHYHECFKHADEFDIIHNHAQYAAISMADLVKTPVVHTWHGTFYEGEVPETKRMILRKFKDHNFISISNNQRQGLPELNYVSTVYNSLDLKEYEFVEKVEGDYILWVGRIEDKKGPIDAILAAKKAHMSLVVAGVIDPIQEDYFKKEVVPLIDGKLISYTGEMHLENLRRLYGNAKALLFPITWHEPFGLVMIEAMACGTPVIGYDYGSVREVIDDGKTGFVVPYEKGVDGLVEALHNISHIQRIDCRRHVEKNFVPEVMVDGYIKAYEKVLQQKRV